MSLTLIAPDHSTKLLQSLQSGMHNLEKSIDTFIHYVKNSVANNNQSITRHNWRQQQFLDKNVTITKQASQVNNEDVNTNHHRLSNH